MFTQREEGETLALAGLRKHDSYGHKKESKHAAFSTAEVLLNGLRAGHVPSPEWSSISWKTPEDILKNPEVFEMSDDGLSKLYSVLEEESYTLERLVRINNKMPKDLREEFSIRWIEKLDDALIHVEGVLSEMLKKDDQYLSVSDFDLWSAPG